MNINKIGWVSFFIIDIIFFIGIIFNFHIWLFVLWTILTIIFLIKVFKQNIIRKDIRKMLIVLNCFFILTIFISIINLFSPSVNYKYKICTGTFKYKDDGYFVYEIKNGFNENYLYKVKVDKYLYNNETEYFKNLREHVLLDISVGNIISWCIDINEINKYQYPVSILDYSNYLKVGNILISNSKKTLEIGNQTFYFAFINPYNYIKFFGLTLAYYAKVIKVDSDSSLISYTDLFGKNKTTIINGNYKLHDTLIVSKNILNFVDTTFSFLNTKYSFNEFGFVFEDSLLSADVVFKQIPQFYQFLQFEYNDEIENDNDKKYLYLGHYFQTKIKSNGRNTDKLIEYQYFDIDNKSKLIDCYVENEEFNKYYAKEVVLSPPVLLNPQKKEVVKINLSNSDILKYKYPVLISDMDVEIGNNSYYYAQIEPQNYLKNFGLTLVYLADINSFSSKNLFDILDVSFTDICGMKHKTKIIVKKSNINSNKILIKKELNTFKSVDLRFQTEFYYNKLKDGYAFSFMDSIITKEELIRDIPQMNDYLDSIFSNI